jgi:hypothetical protein
MAITLRRSAQVQLSPHQDKRGVDLGLTHSPPGRPNRGTSHRWHLWGNKMCLYRGCNESNSATTFANTIVAAVSVMALVGVAGISQPAAQEAKSSVAHVEVVSGRVVAFSRGSPFLLDALDTITDRTRLDLQEHSELHICHYATRQLVVLTGPAQASISADGVTAQNGNAINTSAGTCAAPQISRSQGGLVSRGVNFRQ